MSSPGLMTSALFCGLAVKNIVDFWHHSIFRLVWKLFKREIKFNLAGLKTEKTRRAYTLFKISAMIAVVADAFELAFFSFLIFRLGHSSFILVLVVVVISFLLNFLSFLWPLKIFKINYLCDLPFVYASLKFGIFKSFICILSFIMYLFIIA